MASSKDHGANAEESAHLLRAWATAYRDNPSYRFPSDPHAEFFPQDLEAAAKELDRLKVTVSDAEIEAAAEALWLDANKDRFGTFASIDERVKKLWRTNAKVALQAAELVRKVRSMTVVKTRHDNPVPGSQWRHKKRGSVYSIIGTAAVQIATGEPLTEPEIVIVYQGKDGNLWIRRVSEFTDGRFEPT